MTSRLARMRRMFERCVDLPAGERAHSTDRLEIESVAVPARAVLDRGEWEALQMLARP